MIMSSMDHEPYECSKEKKNSEGWNGKGRLLGGAMRSCRAKRESILGMESAWARSWGWGRIWGVKHLGASCWSWQGECLGDNNRE